jgi:glycosyltransferase involved in cell wall biosynthesis
VRELTFMHKTTEKPVIGLYGGTCNNLYVFAKSLAAGGHQVVFIEDRKDNFPHSQPVWEDVECCFSSGFDYQEIDWTEFEQTHGWSRPSWYYVPGRERDVEGALFHGSRAPENPFTRYAVARFLRKYPGGVAVLAKMQACDFLIVCGIEPALLAMLSGKPYMIFPHGSDMRVAIGAQRKGSGWKGRVVEWLTFCSFRQAAFVGSSLPDASAEVPRSEYRRLQDLKVERIPLPYRYRGRLPRNERLARLQELFAGLGRDLPSAGFYAFTPSRINFFWKGHDRLLRAIASNRERLNIHFIFLGWGDDYREAMDFITRFDLARYVTVLPVFLSKPSLFRFFEGIDFIIDEFNGSGSYGTALSEAMSCGCPVLSWVSEMFDAPGWERPPFIQARTEAQIAGAIMQVSEGQIDLDARSEVTAEWFRRVHGDDAVLSVLFDRIGKIVQS